METASSLVLCTVCTQGVRYAQLTPTDVFLEIWVQLRLLICYIGCLLIKQKSKKQQQKKQKTGFKFDGLRKCLFHFPFHHADYTQWCWNTGVARPFKVLVGEKRTKNTDVKLTPTTTKGWTFFHGRNSDCSVIAYSKLEGKENITK